MEAAGGLLLGLLLLAVAVPVTVVVLGAIISRTVPAFQMMQERLDRVNTVLREQI